MANEEDDDDDDDSDETAKESFAVFVPIASLRSLCSINEILYFRYIKYTHACECVCVCSRTFEYMVVRSIVTPRYRIFCICKFSTIDSTVDRVCPDGWWRWRCDGGDDWPLLLLFFGGAHIWSIFGRWTKRLVISRERHVDVSECALVRIRQFSVQHDFLQIKDFAAAHSQLSSILSSLSVTGRGAHQQLITSPRIERVGESEKGITHTGKPSWIHRVSLKIYIKHR